MINATTMARIRLLMFIFTDGCKDFCAKAQGNGGLPSSCAPFTLNFLGGSTPSHPFDALFSRGSRADDCRFTSGHFPAGTIQFSRNRARIYFSDGIFVNSRSHAGSLPAHELV